MGKELDLPPELVPVLAAAWSYLGVVDHIPVEEEGRTIVVGVGSVGIREDYDCSLDSLVVRNLAVVVAVDVVEGARLHWIRVELPFI